MSVKDRIKMMEQIAMKEREGAPEERGRSPGGVSAKSNVSNDSPRPLSKVRTSFVAIEKDGRIGLQRQANGDSSTSKRESSAGSEAATSSLILLHNTSINVSCPDTNRSDLHQGPGCSALTFSPTFIPDSRPTNTSTQPAASAGRAVSRSPFTAVPTAADSTAARLLAHPNHLGSKRQEGLAESPEIRQAFRSQVRGSPSRNSSGPRRSGSSQSQASKDCEVQAVAVAASSTKGACQITCNGRADKGRPGPSASDVATVSKATVAAPLNGAASKARVTKPTTSTTPSSQSKPAGRNHHPMRSTIPPVMAAKATSEKNVSPAGFVRPRLKSPTRPVALPARLTTHTAASSQKTHIPPPPAHGNRSASRTSLSSSRMVLSRSSSVSKLQRPTFGPPPKLAAKDYPLHKKEAKVDEGFLARMMRPTQASASKKADKVQVPPPPPQKTVAVLQKSVSAKSGPPRRAESAFSTISAPHSVATTSDASKIENSALAQTWAKKSEQTSATDEGVASPMILERAKAVNHKQSEQVQAQKEPTATDLEEAPVPKGAVLNKEKSLPDVPSSPALDVVAETSKIAEPLQLCDNKENVPETTLVESKVFKQEDGDPKTVAETSAFFQAAEKIATSSATAEDTTLTMNTPQNHLPATKEASPVKDGSFSDFMDPGSGKPESCSDGKHEKHQESIPSQHHEEEAW